MRHAYRADCGAKPSPDSPWATNSPLVRAWTLGASSGAADRPVRQRVLRQVVVI